MKSVGDLKVKIFADGANKDEMLKAHQQGMVKGFTTNPTLMKKAGIKDYEAFAQSVLAEITDVSVSFEVFSDELDEMLRQAKKIASWGKNVYVKIPVTNTKGESTAPVIKSLACDHGVQVNVTAIMSLEQVKEVVAQLNPEVPAIVSVFAGRVADTGRDPLPLMKDSLALMKNLPLAELLWASPRELLNIFQADEMGCHIITVTDGILSKLPTVGKDLDEFSLDTVKMFYRDACEAEYSL